MKYINKNIVFIVLGIIFFLNSLFVVYAQDPDVNEIPWNVATQIWNEKLNLYARTSCYLPATSFIKEDGVVVDKYASVCSTDELKKDSTQIEGEEIEQEINDSKLQYYHSWDPDYNYDDPDSNSQEPVLGKLKGKAFSSVFEDIFFSDFPTESSCYGITGENRQPRIQKDEDVIKILGCAYVPLLKEWILFSRTGNTGLTLPTSAPTGWDGVRVDVVKTGDSLVLHTAPDSTLISISPPYLRFYGCGWSEKNWLWLFGLFNEEDEGLYGSGRNGCTTDSDRISKIKNKVSGTDPITGTRVQTESASPSHSSARFGQKVSYTLTCPTGYGIKKYKINEGAEKIIRGVLNFVLQEPILDFELKCSDNRGFFGDDKSIPGSGISVEGFSFTSAKVTPQVLVDGGFVFVKGTIYSFIEDTLCSVETSLLPNNQKYITATAQKTITVNKPYFVHRDVEFVVQCGTIPEITTLGTFAVKVLPNRITERIVRASKKIDAEVVGSNLELKVPNTVKSVNIYALNADVSSALYIQDSTLTEIIFTSPTSENTPSSFEIKPTVGNSSKITKERPSSGDIVLKIPFSVVKSPGATIRKVLVVEGVLADGSRTLRACYGVSGGNALIREC